MRELKLALVSVAIALITGFIGKIAHEDIWQLVHIILLENVLLLVIQIFLMLRDEDSELSAPLHRIQADPQLAKSTAELLEAIDRVREKSNAFFVKQFRAFLGDARTALDSLDNGLLHIDLRPGGFFFREAEAADIAASTLWATSFVDLSSYWDGAMGARILAKNKKKIANHVSISRIFIEYSTNMDAVQRALQANGDIGVTPGLVRADALDPRLRRDFAIIDGGAVAVELILNERREPAEVRYYSQEGEIGRRAIAELLAVWQQLSDLADLSRVHDKKK